MRIFLLILLTMTAAAQQPKPLPGYIGDPGVALTKVAENIFSGELDVADVTHKDSRYWQTSTASGGILPIYSLTPLPLTWSNYAPTVATFDGSTMTMIANGNVPLVATFNLSGRVMSKLITTNSFAQTGAGTNYTYVTNVVGSLAHHVSTNTFALMTGDPSVRRPLWSVKNPETTNYVRNPNFFLASFDGIESHMAGNVYTNWGGTGLPNYGGSYMNGAMISPRHYVSVAHTGGQNEQVLYFVNRTNGEVVIRQAIDIKRATPQSDMTVGLLDEPLPPSFVPAGMISNYAVLLPTYTNQTAIGNFIKKIPVVAFSQIQTPGIHRWTSAGIHPATGTAGAGTTSIDPAIVTNPWGLEIVGGDSGSPAFVLVSNRLCILLTWSVSGGWGGNGGNAIFMQGQIQSRMNELCADHGFTNETLSYVDLTGFTSF